MWNTSTNPNDRFLDIITILSFIIGLENLSLNEEQVNNLEAHLRDQDIILKEEQNVMLNDTIELLKKAIEQNEEIINLLKELKNGL